MFDFNDIYKIIELVASLLSIIGILLISNGTIGKTFHFNFPVFLGANSLLLIWSFSKSLPFVFLLNLFLIGIIIKGIVHQFKTTKLYKNYIYITVIISMLLLPLYLIIYQIDSLSWFSLYNNSFKEAISSYIQTPTELKSFEVIGSILLVNGTLFISGNITKIKRLIAISSFLLYDILIFFVYVSKDSGSLSILTIIAIILNIIGLIKLKKIWNKN